MLVGVLIALPGGLAVLAGLSARRRARQLRSHGKPVWAMAISPPTYPTASAGDQAGPSHRTLVQYQLADGRVTELSLPAPVRKSAALAPGQKVLLWYDPADPQDVLVYGREGRLADRAFLAAGILFILAGAAIAAFAS